MVENYRLRAALLERLAHIETIALCAPVTLTQWDMATACVRAKVSDGSDIKASILVGADGRHSKIRQQAGISVDGWSYKQEALTTVLSHTKPHAGVAYEFFLDAGPLALLPLSGDRSSLVWSDTPACIAAAQALDETAFLSELDRRIGGVLGDMSLCTPRTSYPLSLQMAERYISGRCVLVGDSAHFIHPLAGQGLNMGLRDGAALADVIMQARALGLDIGGASLADYAVYRNFDNRMMAASTDLLDRLFRTRVPYIRRARRAGLKCIEHMPGFQKIIMDEASGCLGALPSLMQA